MDRTTVSIDIDEPVNELTLAPPCFLTHYCLCVRYEVPNVSAILGRGFS